MLAAKRARRQQPQGQKVQGAAGKRPIATNTESGSGKPEEKQPSAAVHKLKDQAESGKGKRRSGDMDIALLPKKRKLKHKFAAGKSAAA